MIYIRKYFLLAIVAIALSFVSSISIVAQSDDSKTKLIAELIAVLKVESELESFTNDILNQLEEAFTKGYIQGFGDEESRNLLSKDEKERISATAKLKAKALRDKVQERTSQSGIIAESVNKNIHPLIDKAFTSSELRELINFYRTPAGQKMWKIRQDLDISYDPTQAYIVSSIKKIMEEVAQEKDNPEKTANLNR